ncbi:MAG: TonB-dependent hemoglobin/transferrin/lactoferrin family receptor [Parvibaculum sp.]|nr:TonB-dependent hemoglobin/transferrin/lactoferrin family receptor [Parvibaculum sp.]
MTRNTFSFLLLAATSALALNVAQAAEPVKTTTSAEEAVEKAAPATQLDVVTTTATRNPEAINDIAGTVSVIDSEELERQGANTIRDAVRYEPGVSISNQPTRGGAAGYSIRGIENNRVLIILDGQTVPDFPGSNFNTPNGYSRDTVDIDTLKRIEIVRGPASVLYGSDALGGVVAYVSKDPADYLDMVGKDWFGSLKLGYASADDSFMATATGAARAGDFEILGLLTRREGHEVESEGSVTSGRGIKNNPMDIDTTSFLTKLVWNATSSDTLKLTGEIYEKDLDVNVLTDLSVPPATTVTSSTGSDETKRNRIAFDYVHDAKMGFIDRLQIKAFYTKMERNEHSEQIRTAGTLIRISDFGYTQDVFGGEAQLNSSFNIGSLINELTYGTSVEYSETERPRFRTQYNYPSMTGGTTVVAGEIFPNKTFPDNDLLKFGIYGQDKLTAGNWTVTPGLRLDYYEMTPHSDQMFLNSGGAPVSDYSEWHLSPKLGTTYQITEQYMTYAQYSHGFRLPPYDSANQTFTNFAQFYGILPNPNLKPEQSDGIEGGFRGKYADGSSFSTAAFYNKYTDFIDTVTLPAGTLPGGLTAFQYQNRPDVVIYGAEAKGEYRFLPQWSLLGSIAYAYGEDQETHASIDSVDPVRLVAGLGYSSESWGAEFTTTHAWTHSRVSPATPAQYQAPDYTTFDLTAYYEIMPTFTINAGIYNITDEKYWLSQDVRGVAATSTVLDRYSQPGRNFAVNTTVRF